MRRLLSLRTVHAVSFWDHLGKNADKALSSRREPDQGDIVHWRCLRFRHFVVSVGDALTLLDDWHGSEHTNTQSCECGVCSDARISSCTSPGTCRAVLIGLVDAKLPVKWDSRTFPPMPDDTNAEARSVFGFTLAWSGNTKTVFDMSMRSLFVAHFKRVTPMYATVPDFLIDDMLGTFAGTLHRYWANLHRKEMKSTAVGDGSGDEGEGYRQNESNHNLNQEAGVASPVDFDFDMDDDDDKDEDEEGDQGDQGDQGDEADEADEGDEGDEGDDARDQPSDEDHREDEAVGRGARAGRGSKDRGGGGMASSSASIHWRIRVGEIVYN